MNTNLPSNIPGRARLLTGAAIVLATLLVTPARATVRWETLEAIHRIENPSDSERPGPCGELGAYQFRERTWRMHTTLPFARALDRRASDAVAVRHYEWLKDRLAQAGFETSPYNIGLAWNGGITSVVRGRIRPSTRDYAERVSNLAATLRRPVVEPPAPLLASSR